jgi:hypothetical protein
LAVKWLRQLRGVPPERRGDVAAAILTLFAASIPYTDPRWARDCLLRLGFDPSGDAPSSEAAWGFQSVLKPSKTFTEIWPHVQAIRTWPEQLRSYLDVLEGKTPSGEFKELENAAKEEWPVLKEALKSKTAVRRLSHAANFPILVHAAISSCRRFDQWVLFSGRGGIGRRACLRCMYPKGCGGSSPLDRTIVPGCSDG